ncbi:ABC transporter ATP-binding protein [candidate division WOR-1 bacterium RIFOXYB2_FULL_42_35]|uniref:ABC transporter ATP-binding protein n=1 Tax=candidate division WOR-1 bacterium RIFOXYC2_FULL_41_25 TaxID=1802586 RepID=A0A1F4TN28_UNCSA|nr:MAG: ABC transporter ATP-binding protein [candidate division WOR-1 bacterium RIFOXYA2_FULL_41_14]OGC24491.1 MAG: ABC transporter ATP-binding protein [candidate division WOR-1 bacterium RIFOXYB2_FULL_42_35]OGC34108.1 MAG: ABC transporter ATP-binding protein [candidate division WOR-1 bacterium RIFOXYC2_FULL_41_25]OGC42803.1 MAG: ABC transporter ATP-binding protein [candidate division WOR-1 bacterium RIFOXYD2_FULL_41_8]
MIELTNLTKYFGSLRIIEDISFTIPKGESLAIIGPSGCGKSTLLKLLIRLEQVTKGSISIDGQDIAKLSEEDLSLLRRKTGFIFQTAALFDSMNVYDNVSFALREHSGKNETEINNIVKEKLALVGLEGKQAMMPAELSGGMQKRVSIARALAFDPKIILYDEPTTGLDPITSVTIEDLMLKLAQELKVTSVIVTHVMQTVERVASKVVMLHEGKFINTGTPKETKQSTDPIVKRFITGGLSLNK